MGNHKRYEARGDPDIECPACGGVAEYNETLRGYQYFICQTCETVHRRPAAMSLDELTEIG